MLGETLLGILAGTLSGVTPGIHVNTLALLMEPLNLSALTLFAMGLTHTFLDAIPSTFLGVPDDGTALSVLPAHRLVLKGRGMEVIRIALVVSALAVFFSLPLLPLYIHIAPLYKPAIGKIAVLGLIILLILTERGWKMALSLFVVLLSGAVGLLVLSRPLNEPLYHLFTGLFGVPVIVSAILGTTARIEPGRADLSIPLRRLVLFSFTGTILGMVTSLVPAFTASQAALIGSFLSRDERSFLSIVYSVNTANFLFGTVNYLETGRARNGIASMMPPAGLSMLPAFLLVAIFTTLVIFLYGEPLAGSLAKTISKLPYRELNVAVLIFLISLSILFDGLLGLLALLASSLVGSLAVLLGVKRTNCMGVLMLPVLLR